MSEGERASRSDVGHGRAMTVAVTGARGFVGRHLVSALVAKGHTVRALTREVQVPGAPAGVEWFEADLGSSDRGQLAEFVSGARVVFHCAGEVTREAQMHAVHVDGTARLVTAATGRVDRVVHVSSCGVYGRVRSGLVREDTATAPEGVYETTKLRAEQIVLDAAAGGAFEAVVLRPSVIISEDMPNASIRNWISRIARGQFFFIGKPGAQVNLVHVEDVVSAMQLAARSDLERSGAFNLSLGGAIEDAVAVICGALGRPMVRRRVPLAVATAVALVGRALPGFPLTRSRVEALTNRAHYGGSRIVTELGFDYAVSLDEGLARLVRSLRDVGGARA